jgi:hypothetical protein
MNKIMPIGRTRRRSPAYRPCLGSMGLGTTNYTLVEAPFRRPMSFQRGSQGVYDKKKPGRKAERLR